LEFEKKMRSIIGAYSDEAVARQYRLIKAVLNLFFEGDIKWGDFILIDEFVDCEQIVLEECSKRFSESLTKNI
jgi:hypothetical protein